MLEPRTTLILAAVLAVGCHRTPTNPLPDDPAPGVAERSPADAAPLAEAADVPAGSLRAKHVQLAFALYYLPKARVAPLAALRSLPAAQGFQVLTALPDAPPDAPTVSVLSPRIEDVPPPRPESLKYAVQGLDDAQQKAFLATSQVTALVFHARGDDVDATHARALKVVGALARLTGGLPWDSATRQIFSLEEWQKRVDAFEHGVPTVAKHIRIDVYRDGELLRLVTLGMEKMGLPDVAVSNVASSDAKAMGSLVNLLCQALAERAALEKSGEIDLAIDGIKSTVARTDIRLESGAKQRVRLRLAIGAGQEGDSDNRLIDIVFPGSPDTLQERQDGAIVELFGARDQTAHIQHDPELLAASARARAKLMALKPIWSKRIPELQHLLVKAPFKTTSGGNEWMWVELTRWQGSTIHGLLENDPSEVPSLHAGARVAVEESAVFDYILVKADGSREGNETAALIEKQ